VLSRPGATTDWLATTLFLACALLVARAAALRGALDTRELLLILFYVAASAAANAIPFTWDAVVFGTAVSVRGIAFAVLMLGATVLLEANDRPVRASRASLIVAAIAASATAWPSSQLLWCGLPPMLALLLFGIESKVAARGNASFAAALRVPAS
jgi:hypothetical protein